ncbi:ATPase, UPF0079 family [Croceitalea dokdonensis DOKDO 023]|uniref:tRNA threonylcarbamoyladenosine biosynthesis protein TsaE n=1 Tax=Croceitalea dokdonensis DOKDO 023 TaxID=1300341 RepID=A0A0P7AYS1_9FLAO|nr:tRNA (adenosine(37)-N6)-threonylcarbamoyltransferase complex ATPase subunit type 1 TsaE [Croceitalea dokdonensis]KPM33323.1 ATPase, UPF0079 family [Croceitalea dokdonensis DOKDO 023]
MKNIIYIKKDIPDISEFILRKTEDNVYCFHGQMGVGKTTLIKAMLQGLGAKDAGHSPTFGLVNEYHDVHGQPLAYHFDFYRIHSEEEVYDMGFEDYVNRGAYVFIEWPERIPNLLPEDAVHIKLQLVDENTRRIEF